jgi:hypothetical protein
MAPRLIARALAKPSLHARFDRLAEQLGCELRVVVGAELGGIPEGGLRGSHLASQELHAAPHRQ